VVLQGAKEVAFGDRTLRYDAMQSLIVSIELPAQGRIVEASPGAPFIGLHLDLDITGLRAVLEGLENPPQPADAGFSVFVDDLTGPLADCVLRLLRLAETPDAIPVLYPALQREICYWLLAGKNGSQIALLALPDSHTRRIADAIRLLRQDFARTIRVEELAQAARMSPSSFHHHFKTLTAMTPLQYQKQLRLIEARRLMLTDAANASNAAYRVGYESASQFSREYARMFGAPPKRDVAALKAMPAI
jgi:AraC-like DNA-binding protein